MSTGSLKDWVPSYLQSFLEKRVGPQGFSLHELAVLAATLEDIIHKESIGRLGKVYNILHIPTANRLDERHARNLVDTYMMIFLRGGNISATNPSEAEEERRNYFKYYADWEDTEKWLREVQRNATSQRLLDFAASTSVVEEIGNQFGRFNDGECQMLKSVLLKMEDASKPGRVQLKDFYRKSLHSHWKFNEKVDYLRSLGALDEADPDNMRVIIPNYVGSRPQCLEASNFYAVCCRNECEDMMLALEREAASPQASPKQVMNIVEKRRSSSKVAWNASATLIHRLDQIAGRHGGHVPIHGRLFAQWMHHAFPRDCPHPQETAVVGPQTPDAWLKQTGQQTTKASDEEMQCQVSGEGCGDSNEAELPWTDAEELLHEKHIVAEDVEEHLVSELTATFRSSAKKDRLDHLEAALRPMYNALPKDDNGNLGHTVVRYALHRLFLQQHGWFIKGLEPNVHASSQSYTHWVPNHLQSFLEQRIGERGFTLREVAVLAATLEDLIHKEGIGRLQITYSKSGVSQFEEVHSEQANFLMDAYWMTYLRGGNITAQTPEELRNQVRRFKSHYTDWPANEKWLRSLQRSTWQADKLDFAAATNIIETLGEKYGSFNDQDCQSLKSTLLRMEDATKPGRVTLSDFYQKSLHSHWHFNEKIDYLRTLGALDESEKGKPRVIVPNYVSSRPQCLEASSFYAVCCRNECEEITSYLEKEIAQPSASAQTILRVLSQTFRFGGSKIEVSETLRRRLDEIASRHGGSVPIHGRLFAQWMHHVFPRECPYPHEAGTTSPQTADEWMKATGQNSSTATREDMKCHTEKPRGKITDRSAELPWSDTEALFHAAQRPAQLRAFNSGLRLLVLSGIAFGLVMAFKFALPSAAGRPRKMTIQQQQSQQRAWLVTLALLLFPLMILSLDYLTEDLATGFQFIGTVGRELFVCVLCWGFIVIVYQKAKDHLGISPSGTLLPF